MKEYRVITIECPKEYSITQVFSMIRSKINSDKNIFYIHDLKRSPSDMLSKSFEKLYNETPLEKFWHQFTPEVFVKAGDTDYACWILSNLDDRWTSPNPNTCGSLSEEELNKVFTMWEKRPKNRLPDIMVGLDEIQWNGKPVSKGTYGCKKAEAWNFLGKTYLSNSVIVSRYYNDTRYSVYLSVEACFRDLPIIQEIAESLGKIKSEQVYYAPETEAERETWDKSKEEAEVQFNKALEGIQNLTLEEFENYGDSRDASAMGVLSTGIVVNVRQMIKKHLCDNAWSIRKKLPDEEDIMVSKDKGDAVLSLCLMPQHKGHTVHLDIDLRSKRFYFTERMRLIYVTTAREDQVEIFIKNARIIRDYLDSCIDDFHF